MNVYCIVLLFLYVQYDVSNEVLDKYFLQHFYELAIYAEILLRCKFNLPGANINDFVSQ